MYSNRFANDKEIKEKKTEQTYTDWTDFEWIFVNLLINFICIVLLLIFATSYWLNSIAVIRPKICLFSTIILQNTGKFSNGMRETERIDNLFAYLVVSINQAKEQLK